MPETEGSLAFQRLLASHLSGEVVARAGFSWSKYPTKSPKSNEHLNSPIDRQLIVCS